MEDAPAGIEAARRAGMAVVGITTTHPPAALATPHLVRDFTALAVVPGKDGEFWLQSKYPIDRPWAGTAIP
jgi:beta-phosphoglucomutase-like phosphatase (HAD superfamily)